MSLSNTERHAWHALSAQESLELLRSSVGGLSTEDARSRIATFGLNVLPPVQHEGAWSLLWRQIHNPLIYVLLGSGFFALLMGRFTDGAVVLGVVVVNALIGFAQEWRASKAIAALGDLVPEEATVHRDDRPVVLPAQELVPGDVVTLAAGNRVPADLRLLSTRGLQAEEAALTGESAPVSKVMDTVDEEASLGDRRNLLFKGTLITSGTGTGVVVRTGIRTELGRISQLLDTVEELQTPLTRQLERVAVLLTWAIAAVAVALFGLGMIRGFTTVDSVMAAITLAVAAIPEGLPAIVSIALAVGVQRMAARHALIRYLPAVETLGATTVICSDKTGTLTRGEMTVRALWVSGESSLEVIGSGYMREGSLLREGRPAESAGEGVEALMRAGMLCNDSFVHPKGDVFEVTGDPTEAALLLAAERAVTGMLAERADHPRLDVIPFESERQYMAALHEDPDGEAWLYVKGSPEAIFARCNWPDSEPPEDLRQALHEFTARGMRVLAFAQRPAEGDSITEADVQGLTFLGLQAMIDPPRAEAARAIEQCHQAGVTVKMITGDHRITAAAIGEKLNLTRRDQPTFTGPELERMDDGELAKAVAESNVFARVSPEQKLRLVRVLQGQGEVVAMTGDGVNDGPALRQANIGVAMGKAGTAVAREAADMVLTDDHFASIAAAVEEGRHVYDNLVKSLAFVLPTNIGEALIVLCAVAFFPVSAYTGHVLMPMEPMQVLWINLVATVALALPLAMEAREPGLMRRPPRPPGEPLLTRFVILRTVGVALLMTVAALILFQVEFQLELADGFHGRDVARAQTAAVTTVFLFQVVYLFQCRSLTGSVWQIGWFSNPWIYVGVAILIPLQLAYIYLPFMNDVFNSAPIGWGTWLRSLLAALVIVPLVSAEKLYRRRRHDRMHAQMRTWSPGP